MHDDEMIDRLLRDAMSADRVPHVSAAFDARVLRRVRPRRLTTMGRLVIAAYIMAAAATTLWLMRDLSPAAIAAALAVGVPVAAGVGIYGRRLARS